MFQCNNLHCDCSCLLILLIVINYLRFWLRFVCPSWNPNDVPNMGPHFMQILSIYALYSNARCVYIYLVMSCGNTLVKHREVYGPPLKSVSVEGARNKGKNLIHIIVRLKMLFIHV